MWEKHGVAHCASTFAQEGCPPQTVYAAPVFVPVTMSTDELPLEKLYGHPDFVDLISAQEFGLEQTEHGMLLLCIVVAAAPDALPELAGLIAPVGRLAPCCTCEEADGTLTVRMEEAEYRVASAGRTDSFSAALRPLPLYAALAALSTWCTGYACTVYREETK